MNKALGSEKIDKRFSTFACATHSNGGAAFNAAPACTGPV